MKALPTPISFVLVMYITSMFACKLSSPKPIKFDRAKWLDREDLRSYPYRDDMLTDLIKHHQIKGLTRKQLVDSLGEGENYEDSKDSLYYDIIVNYGYLDPKSGKYLVIGFDRDSIANYFKVVEWKNRHANE